jgi:hypothetical protein
MSALQSQARMASLVVQVYATRRRHRRPGRGVRRARASYFANRSTAAFSPAATFVTVSSAQKCMK